MDGELTILDSSTDENGEVFAFTAVREGNSMSIKGMKAEALKAPIFPTTHWNAAILGQRRILNTLTGRENAVEISRVGVETVTTENGEIRATRYAYTGDLTNEVWYDSAGRWVKMRFQGKDGSTIEYMCRRCQDGGSMTTN